MRSLTCLLGSHAYNASSSGDENGLFAPSDNSVRYDALMASGFDQNFAPTQQPFGSFFEFAQIPDSYSTATDGDAYGVLITTLGQEPY